MTNLIIGTLENGNKCVYDTPSEIKNAEQFKSIKTGGKLGSEEQGNS